MHLFKVGQSVVLRLEPPVRQDTYEVIRCLPEWPDGEPMYRLRSTTNRSERIVRESEIRSAGHDHQPGQRRLHAPQHRSTKRLIPGMLNGALPREVWTASHNKGRNLARDPWHKLEVEQTPAQGLIGELPCHS